MSKMIKLLNKMSGEKMAETYKSKLNDPQTRMGSVNESPSPQEVVVKTTYINSTSTEKNRAKPLFTQSRLFTISIGFNTAVLLVAIFSLIVSFNTRKEIHSSQILLAEIAEQYQPQIEKINSLVKSIDEDKNEMRKILSVVEGLRGDVKNQQAHLETLLTEKRMAQATAEDLKASNKLLLNKYIALNNEVIEIKKTLQNQTPNASAGERN